MELSYIYLHHEKHRDIRFREAYSFKGEGKSFYIYFSAPNCGVCEALRPKLQEFMSEKFPLLNAFCSDIGRMQVWQLSWDCIQIPPLSPLLEGRKLWGGARWLAWMSWKRVWEDITKCISIEKGANMLTAWSLILCKYYNALV